MQLSVPCLLNCTQHGWALCIHQISDQSSKALRHPTGKSHLCKTETFNCWLKSRQQKGVCAHVELHPHSNWEDNVLHSWEPSNAYGSVVMRLVSWFKSWDAGKHFSLFSKSAPCMHTLQRIPTYKQCIRKSKACWGPLTMQDTQGLATFHAQKCGVHSLSLSKHVSTRHEQDLQRSLMCTLENILTFMLSKNHSRWRCSVKSCKCISSLLLLLAGNLQGMHQQFGCKDIPAQSGSQQVWWLPCLWEAALVKEMKVSSACV